MHDVVTEFKIRTKARTLRDHRKANTSLESETSSGQRCLDLMAEDVGYGVREAIAESYRD